MGLITIEMFATLDLIGQAPGGPDEDAEGGFPFGGWQAPLMDEVAGAQVGEAYEGTDALLARCIGLRREGPGGVLVKLVKPGQDRRLDLPTIGPVTVQGAVAAGLAGIAVEAGGTILVDRPATIAAADAAGLFLLALRPEETATNEENARR